MSDWTGKKPIVRYSELARDAKPPDTTAPASDLSFRAIEGLKNSGRVESPGVTVRSVIPDNGASELFRRASREASLVYDEARHDQSFRVDPLFGLAEAIVGHPAPDQLIRQIFEEQKHTLSSHRNAATCAILAAQIGRGLGYHPHDLVQLTVAALLHDIGLQKLPQGLMEKPGKLTAEEFAQVQSHPELGHRLLMQLAPQHSLVAQIVRQEHEREDGQGYPNRLSSNAIHDAAKVVGVTDTYDALITPRPYRKAFCPHEAIKELLDCQERMGYARHVVRALIQQLTLFPVGCWVRLSSGEIGRVIQTNERSPLRPTVEVRYADGQPTALSRIVDLNENPLVQIAASLCAEEIPTAEPATA